MLVSSPRPKHSITGFLDKVGNVCYKVLQCPDALRRAKTQNNGWSQNMRYINKISILWIIYHQKGLDKEILKQQTKLCNFYSILRYKRNTTKMSKVLYYNSNTRCSNQLSYPALEFNQLILYLYNCQPKDTYSARHIQCYSLHARSTL